MIVKVLLHNSPEIVSENFQKFLEMYFNLCVTDARGDKKPQILINYHLFPKFKQKRQDWKLQKCLLSILT